jgi:hypothetical protein
VWDPIKPAPPVTRTRIETKERKKRQDDGQRDYRSKAEIRKGKAESQKTEGSRRGQGGGGSGVTIQLE